MVDAFDRMIGKDSEKGDAFDRMDIPDEGFIKSAFRTVYQGFSGIAQASTYPADLFNVIATGAAFDQEEIDSLKRQANIYGIPFNEEDYKSAASTISQYTPTQGNLERIIEEKTGIPLEAKTKLQKAIKLGSTAGKLSPGTLSQKTVATATAPAVSLGLQSAGVPEGVSEFAGLALSPLAATSSPKISIGSKKKASGLTTRRYESLEKPTEISSGRSKKINDTIEGEFRDISQNIIKDSPVENTYTSLKDDVQFKQSVGEQFRDVENLASEIPGSFNSGKIKESIASKLQKKEAKGISPSEYDRDYNQFMNDFVSKTPDKEITAANLVEQYRKNNRSLSELYEPAKSRAFNRAKKDSLLDYNTVIAETIENSYPNSEFSELFKGTNKKWTEIKDAEFLNKYVDDLFDGKVNFEKGKKFYDRNVQESFKRSLGNENFPKFEQLMKDLLSTEKANKLLKVAEQKGFYDLAKDGLKYLVHPSFLKGKILVDLSKTAYKSLLNKPKLTVTWDRGVNAAKAGNFKVAQKEFSILDQQLNPRYQDAKKQAIQKFSQNQKKVE